MLIETNTVLNTYVRTVFQKSGLRGEVTALTWENYSVFSEMLFIGSYEGLSPKFTGSTYSSLLATSRNDDPLVPFQVPGSYK